MGALATGSIDGAVASGTTAVSVPALDNYLKEQGLDDTAREAVLLGFSASVGASIGASIGGDTASTVSSFNQTDNNYLSHKQMQEWIKALEKTGSDPRRREQINSFYLKLDREQQADFINDCETNYNYQRCAEHVKRFHEGNTYKGNTLFDPNLYSKIEELGKLETDYLKNTVTSHNDYVFRNNSRWEGEAAYKQDDVLGVIAQGAVGVGASRFDRNIGKFVSKNISNPNKLIDDFRSHKKGMDTLGETIPVKADNKGTVAVIDINGKPVFGVNSSALIRDKDKNLGRQWRTKLGLNRGQAQVVSHAEAHSLMRAYQKTNGQMPKTVNMHVDRLSCGTCQTYLPKLTEAMGIERLNITFKDGRSASISNGKFIGDW